jgi:hypothetical protein
MAPLLCGAAAVPAGQRQPSLGVQQLQPEVPCPSLQGPASSSSSRQAAAGSSSSSRRWCALRAAVCGLRLSLGGAAAAGIAGCSRLPQGVLDGSPALAVGASLSDVVLD